MLDFIRQGDYKTENQFSPRPEAIFFRLYSWGFNRSRSSALSRLGRPGGSYGDCGAKNQFSLRPGIMDGFILNYVIQPQPIFGIESFEQT